ncbi:hypothetical protein G7Z17_g9805 [Cylindrodendrum hubeiense]|uniref:DUF2423 domain-containing protein n=1 Tax=Cylindrodendrum hubeiense TaxID=595255 RepID=A0A9P5H4A6_9HYPO|nr:hypothetical protein G7Z17_g9805 [Cylindrodendrum hubeiense]
MAKSARSSSRKANNQRLAANVFGPVEAARAERLHAKLIELAKQPKPESAAVPEDADKAEGDETTMDVDSAKPSTARNDKKRVDKRRVKKAGIVFRKYSDRIAAKKKKAASSAAAATATETATETAA